MQLFVRIKSYNKDKCRCECIELTDKGVCDKEHIWNLSNDISECLDYKNCDYKMQKEIVDMLADECNETLEEVKPTIITLAENLNSYKYSS